MKENYIEINLKLFHNGYIICVVHLLIIISGITVHYWSLTSLDLCPQESRYLAAIRQFFTPSISIASVWARWLIKWKSLVLPRQSLYDCEILWSWKMNRTQIGLDDDETETCDETNDENFTKRQSRNEEVKQHTE